jgi:hypothetical protein
MTWQIFADGKLVARGLSLSAAVKRDVATYALAGIATVATPKREAHYELHDDGVRICGGPARCERWGSELLINGAGWRLEAGR